MKWLKKIIKVLTPKTQKELDEEYLSNCQTIEELETKMRRLETSRGNRNF
jgi:hypothetical protein